MSALGSCVFSYVFVCLFRFTLGVDGNLFLTFILFCYLCVLSLVLLTFLFDRIVVRMDACQVSVLGCCVVLGCSVVLVLGCSRMFLFAWLILTLE